MSRIDWSKQEAPSLAELEAIADAAYRRLPQRFRALTSDVLIRIEEFPTDEVLDSLGIESPFDLLGLYSGIDLARKSIMDVSAVPDMVFLYRRPILDYWAEHEEALGPSSPMCWFTRSVIISACPMTTWNTSRPKPSPEPPRRIGVDASAPHPQTA